MRLAQHIHRLPAVVGHIRFHPDALQKLNGELLIDIVVFNKQHVSPFQIILPRIVRQ